MDIEEKILEISKSLDEKKFNQLIFSILDTNLTTKKNICEMIFKKIDIEITKSVPNENLLRALISVPVELAIQEQTNKQNEQLEYLNFIDFISSHLLARSNVQNHSLRLAMSVFYSNVANQLAWKKQKILERFGENILNSIFEIYTSKNEKSSMALSFLFENFETFLSLSPGLASMTNSFLQKLMLQTPSDFINFITQYKNFLQKKCNSSEFFIIHLSFLIQNIFELNHERLMGYVLNEFIEYVYSFNEAPCKVSKNFQILSKILSQSKSTTAQEIGTYIKKMLDNQQKISCHQLFKQINLTHEKEVLIDKNKNNFKKLSPFQKIVLLHNDT